MITLDIYVFFWYFAVYTVTGRMVEPALYEQSRQALDAFNGLLSTLVLLTSSWVVVLAVHAARDGDRRLVRRYLLIAILVAACFAILKFYGYANMVEVGIVITTNEFFRYFYAFTIIHFFHYFIGMGILIFCYAKAGRDPMNTKFVHWIESSASYWHKVDMLWIILFPMFYLMKAS